MAPPTPIETNAESESPDEESPVAQDPSWLDEPLFPEEGTEPPPESSFWEKVWLTPRLEPVSRRLLPNEHPVASVWNRFTSQARYLILFFVFFLLWPFGLLSFRAFTSSTDSTFHPIPSTPSYQAQAAFSQSYSNDFLDPMNPGLFVVLESGESMTSTDSSVYEYARNFTVDLSQTLDTTCWKISGDSECQSEPRVQTLSFFTFKDLALSSLANAMASPDGKTLLVQVNYALSSNSTHPKKRSGQVMDVIDQFVANANPDHFTVSFTGISYFESDLIDETQKDLGRMDAIVLPLALILLGVVLPRARPAFVWIVPLITMISTVCSWSFIMKFVAKHMQITQFTPSIMMSLTLGMGIDYTLFLLSRYLEDTTDKAQAIRVMIQQGGNVVMLSGLTLMCTFLGLCFLPLGMLKSIGVGAAVSIACSLLINLSVVPALLHTQLGDLIIQKESPEDSAEEDDLDPLATIVQAPNNDVEPKAQVPSSSFWYWLGKNLLHPYKSIIIILVITQLFFPVARFATKLRTSISFDLLMPSASPSLETYHSLADQLGSGALSPYRVLFDSAGTNFSITSQEGYDVMHRVLDELVAFESVGTVNGITHVTSDTGETQELIDALMDVLGLSKSAILRAEEEKDEVLCTNELQAATAPKYTQYNGIAVLKNTRIPHSLYSASKVCANVKPHCPVEVLHLLDYVDEAFTSQDENATYATATLPIDPFSDKGVQWLEAARDTVNRLEEANALSGVKVYIEGPAAVAYDAVATVMHAFPKVVVITLLVVFFLMGSFFRSIVPPLRSVISISFTLSFVFGLGALVFEEGIFNWTHIPHFRAGASEVCWLVPVMAFSIIVGLALDYDVFLVSRILEFRTDEAYGHESSIVAGLHATGGIITAAGLIMAIAFGGLMMSSSPVLYQWSFLLTTAVLLDTFVIRTLVVPIITGWTGKYSWWPRKLPLAHVFLDGFDGQEEVATASADEPGALTEPLLNPPPLER